MLNETTGERHLTTLPPSASACASASASMPASTCATNQTSVNLYYCGLVLPPADATSEEERRREREIEWKRLVESERPGVEEAHLKYRRQMLENAEDGFISKRSKKNKKWGEERTRTQTRRTERAEKAEKLKMKLKDCKKAIAEMFRKMAPAPRKDRKAGTTREVLC